MSQFQTLIRSRDSPPKHKNFDISCVYWCHHADAGVDKWLGGKCTLYKQDTKNSSTDNICFIFEDKYIFMGNFNISSRLYQPNSWNCNNEI